MLSMQPDPSGQRTWLAGHAAREDGQLVALVVEEARGRAEVGLAQQLPTNNLPHPYISATGLVTKLACSAAPY